MVRIAVPEIDLLVFDILGTLVDAPAGVRAGIRATLPTTPEPEVERLLERWQTHVGQEQHRIVAGERPFADSDVLDREAAHLVLAEAGVDDPAARARLAETAARPPAWPDSARGLARLAARFPLIGLSNAGRSALPRLNASAGLRFHQALSAESARTYKPAATVYRLAVDLVGIAPERLLMVAAHAWDLRGARAVGMRTAYLPRPVGDPPADGERFDVHAASLADLADHLAVPAAEGTARC